MSHHYPPLKVALLSDTHGVLDAQVAEVIDGSDWIVHAGDIGSAAVLRQLAQLGGKLVAVRGNNDTPSRWPEQDHDILTALPHERTIPLPGGDLIVVHGHRLNPAGQRHDKLRRRYPGARAVVYGHSHRLVEDLAHPPWVLNPGAAGRDRTHGGPSCMILHVLAGQWQVRHHRFVLQRR